jgi:uncharacterized membrane protein YcaP (DUF421 family)
MPPIDWDSAFSLTVSPLELALRGSLVYWFIFLAFRIVLRREVGSIAIADVLVLVLIADAAQNAMASEYKSVPEGLVLISTIIFWNYMVDWAAFRFPPFRRLVEPRPLMLVRDGEILRRNLRKEFVTEEELGAKLRENGVEDVGEVRACYMESDGTVTVIKRRPEDTAHPKRRLPAAGR